MIAPDKLNAIIERIARGKYTEEDLQVLLGALTTEQNAIIERIATGKYTEADLQVLLGALTTEQMLGALTTEQNAIIERIATGKYTEADLQVLLGALTTSSAQSNLLLDKYNVNISQGQDIQVGDRLYAKWSDEAIQSLIEVIKNQHDSIPLLPKELPQEDYIRLKNLLASGGWREANEATRTIILKAVSQDKEGWLGDEQIQNFPYQVLHIVDRLWLHYSNERFGFSVQKRICDECEKDPQAFGDRVGWRVQNAWISASQVIYTPANAPDGHLPWGIMQVITMDNAALDAFVKGLRAVTKTVARHDWQKQLLANFMAFGGFFIGDRINKEEFKRNLEYELSQDEAWWEGQRLEETKVRKLFSLLVACPTQPQPLSRNKAISRIEFVRENILDLEVDAIVRPTNTSLSFGGKMSNEILTRLGLEFRKKWQNQPKPSIGEVLVTDASSLPTRYIFHTPIDYNVDATVTTISQAITAALTTAESLGDVRTIAFPSVGTGLRGLSPANLAPKILRIVATHLEHGSQLEKVIFAFIDEFAYRAYVSAYQMLLLEAVVAYEVFMAISPEAALVGGEIEVSIDLRQVRTTDGKANVLQVPRSEAAGAELNILLTAPGFQFNGDNTASLPLDPNTGHITQTACFRLTALRPGTATITAELYCGDTFETNLEAKMQVTRFDEASLLGKHITTQPRPVPQPDFILKVQTAWNETNSACRFQYQLRSFRLPSLFSGETSYHSESLSNSWIEQMRRLLGTTLENISNALPEDGRSHLTSLGQYLFQNLLPPELQTDFRSLIPRDHTFTLLILVDQDASLPWELLHDGQRFLSDRFIIGRWFWELNDTRPHEFPVGAINVAHYADVEQPELWTALLEPPGSPPPLPLPDGVLGNCDSTEAMRGLHLIRYSQSSDVTNRHNAPVTLDDTNNAQDIERQMRPAKLNLRRNRPLVSLGYVRRDHLWWCPPWGNRPELTTLEQTWASVFIRAGCSAFTGSLWAVDPAVEAAFISGFYNRLWTGDSLGEAFHASRQLARAVAPDSLDWLAYVLFGDPMARPYRPVEGKGYAVVEPIGREIDDPLPPGVPVRFRLSLRRTPPVWHEERVIEVAENLTFENLQAHVKTFGLQVTPDSPIAMSLAPTGNYLGWFTLVASPEMAGNSALVQVFLMDGILPIHSLMFSLNIENEGS